MSQQFWPILGQPLLDVFLVAFHDTTAGSLSTSQLRGTIGVIYKGIDAPILVLTDPSPFEH